MSLLTGVNTATDIEKNTDRLGGGFQLLDSAVHLMDIEVAYLVKSASGARAVAFHCKNDAGVLRSTQYFASGNAKGNKTYYENKGKKHNLPGFVIVNDMFIAAGFENGLADAQLEEKIIKLYDRDAGGEVPTKVEMVMNLLGKQVALGVLKQTVDKTALGGDNQYHPTGETRDENELVKVFTPEGFTILETEDESILDPTWILSWKEKYDGQVIMKAKGVSKDAAGAGAPTPKPKKMFK